MPLTRTCLRDVGDVALTIQSLLLGRVLRICSIEAVGKPAGLSPEELEELGFAEDSGFGLEYELIPAGDPTPPEGADHETLAAWSNRNNWWFTAHDELGTAYEGPSGVEGLSPDGTATHGVVDVYPTPPPDARGMDFTFHGDGYEHGYTNEGGRQFVLRAPLPLPVASAGEGLKAMGMTLPRLVSSIRALRRIAENAKPGEDGFMITWYSDDPASSDTERP